eukprot:5699699-Amphidinium_carterae.1
MTSQLQRAHLLHGHGRSTLALASPHQRWKLSSEEPKACVEQQQERWPLAICVPLFRVPSSPVLANRIHEQVSQTCLSKPSPMQLFTDSCEFFQSGATCLMSFSLEQFDIPVLRLKPEYVDVCTQISSSTLQERYVEGAFKPCIALSQTPRRALFGGQIYRPLQSENAPWSQRHTKRKVVCDRMSLK